MHKHICNMLDLVPKKIAHTFAQAQYTTSTQQFLGGSNVSNILS